MEKVGVGNADELSASELLRSVEPTNSVSYVTMRKHKKSNRNVIDEQPVEPIPHGSGCSHDSDVESSPKSKHDFIETLFGVSLNTLEDIDAFAKAVEAGNYPVWDTLDEDVVQRVQVAVDGLWKAFKASLSGPLVDEDVCGKDLRSHKTW